MAWDITEVREIVNSETVGKVSGKTMDIFTAGAIVAAFDLLNPANQAKAQTIALETFVDFAFKVTG